MDLSVKEWLEPLDYIHKDFFVNGPLRTQYLTVLVFTGVVCLEVRKVSGSLYRLMSVLYIS